MFEPLLYVALHILILVGAFYNRTLNQACVVDILNRYTTAPLRTVLWLFFCSTGLLLARPTLTTAIVHFMVTMTIFTVTWFPPILYTMCFYGTCYVLAFMTSITPRVDTFTTASRFVVDSIPQQTYRDLQQRIITPSLRKDICRMVRDDIGMGPNEMYRRRSQPPSPRSHHAITPAGFSNP